MIGTFVVAILPISSFPTRIERKSQSITIIMQLFLFSCCLCCCCCQFNKKKTEARLTGKDLHMSIETHLRLLPFCFGSFLKKISSLFLSSMIFGQLLQGSGLSPGERPAAHIWSLVKFEIDTESSGGRARTRELCPASVFEVQRIRRLRRPSRVTTIISY